MFSLSDLTPAREPFDLGDGRAIYFRNKADFDLQELAAWERLRRAYKSVTDLREKAQNEEQYAYASRKSEQASREIIGLVLPDLPSEVRDRLTAGQIDQLSAICQMVARGDLRRSSASDEQLAAMAEKFPELPSEFIAGLTRHQAQLLLGNDEQEAAPKNPTAQPLMS